MLAARRSTVVITTVGETINSGNAAARDVVAANPRMLRRHHVALAIGSDAYRAGVIPEVMALHSLGIFSNADLLQLRGEAIAVASYPHRKIGCFHQWLRGELGGPRRRSARRSRTCGRSRWRSSRDGG
jgi:hypothetical protein